MEVRSVLNGVALIADSTVFMGAGMGDTTPCGSNFPVVGRGN
ncbi:hypothetical protein [Kocuria sabuli]